MQSSQVSGSISLPVAHEVLDQLGEKLLQDRVATLRFRNHPKHLATATILNLQKERGELIVLCIFP